MKIEILDIIKQDLNFAAHPHAHLVLVNVLSDISANCEMFLFFYLFIVFSLVNNSNGKVSTIYTRT